MFNLEKLPEYIVDEIKPITCESWRVFVSYQGRKNISPHRKNFNESKVRSVALDYIANFTGDPRGSFATKDLKIDEANHKCSVVVAY